MNCLHNTGWECPNLAEGASVDPAITKDINESVANLAQCVNCLANKLNTGGTVNVSTSMITEPIAGVVEEGAEQTLGFFTKLKLKLKGITNFKLVKKE